eukprot:311196-Alexandrium_andersonii.AAC.1
MKSQVEADQAKLPRGAKQQAHRETLKAFILANGVNEMFMKLYQEASFNKGMRSEDWSRLSALYPSNSKLWQPKQA